MPIRLRPFESRDYERLAQIGAAVEPHTAFNAQMWRHRDAFVEPHVRMQRVVAEAESGAVVGVGRIMHIWWNYHPRRFQLRIEVDPSWQQRGVGSRLFDHLLTRLRAWEAELVRSEIPATREASVAFVEHRDFQVWRRRWESVLDVASANTPVLADAARRTAEHGIVLTTYADEQARRGERLPRELYELEIMSGRDEPGFESSGEPVSFERFRSVELDTPNALPQAHFLALADGRLVGISRLVGDFNHPLVLHQAFTGTHPEYRGRGIAQTLKLRTIEFAREHGFEQIRTSNDATNEPMLHINDAIGFKRETPMIIVERRLA